ncbi:MAG: 6-carboxytetrahydropterin synthase QueD [Syntrophorhabdaceae bacterium]|nr:6-carboxytetrahydropterin synthase QueD [Syntrophorhabdaceae bacterium]
MAGTYALTVGASIAAAHRLREYDGNCERLHGHNWKIDVTVESKTLDERGIALDFREIKSLLSEILSRYDHIYMNEVSPFDTINPSSENFARHIFEEMEKRLPSPVKVSKVAVWESEGARAEYFR